MYFIEQFQKQVANYPDKIAVSAMSGNFTFSALDQLARQIAYQLVTQKSQNIVPFYILDTRFVLPCVLGIWYAGCIPMPLVSAIAIDSALDRISEVDWNKLLVDRDITGMETKAINVAALGKSDKTIEVERPQAAYAYILSTSGSTGVPKKVFLKIDNLKWLLNAFYPVVGMNERAKFLFTTPCSFDVSLTEILAPVLARAELVCLPAEPSKPESIRLIHQWLQQGVISHLSLSPSFADALLGIGGIQVFDKLSYLMLAGENFPIQLAKKLRPAMIAGCRVFNLYGPTETTIYATYHEVQLDEQRYVPIGRPFPGGRLRFEVESAEKGELYIGGAGLTAGYCLDAKKQAEKFQFIDGVAYYQTGDQVERLANGEYVFLGRNDDQIQINGIRVELGEVTYLTEKIAGVKACASIFDQGRLYIFYQADSEMNNIIKETLPSYLSPILIHVPHFLYNPNRKLDGKAMIATFYRREKNKQTTGIIDKLENLLIPYQVKALEDLDSLAFVRYLIDLEEAFGIVLSDQEVSPLMGLAKLATLIEKKRGELPKPRQEAKKVRGADLFNLHFQLQARFVKGYKEEKILASSTQQSLFKQGKTSFARICLDLGGIDLAGINRVNDCLQMLSERIDVCRYAWFKDEKGQLYFKERVEARIPLVMIEGPLEEADLQAAFYREEGQGLCVAFIDVNKAELQWVFSHHSLDAASQNRLKSYLYQSLANEAMRREIPHSSFAEFMRYVNRVNQGTDLQVACDRLPQTAAPLSLSRDANYLHVIQFPIDGQTNDAIYEKALYIIGKCVMMDSPRENLTGQIALNIRRFDDFDAQDIIGDVHATLPFELRATDTLQDFKARYQAWKTYYRTGVDYRFCLMNHIGSNMGAYDNLEARWHALNISPNYIGEVRDLKGLIDEIWTLPFKADYITMVSHQGQLSAILYGDLLKQASYNIMVEGQKLIVTHQKRKRENFGNY